MNIKVPFKLAVVSDIHKGNRRTPTSKIIDNLDEYLSNQKFLSTIDILFLAGDVFDELLDMSMPESHLIVLWFAKLLRLCKQFNVKLRVLEGTPSHDRHQSEWVVTANEINKQAGFGEPDLRYVKTLEIEYIEDFGINVLYLPDKWGKSAQDALDQIHTLLAKHELQKVDFAIMHGAFDFQLPFQDATTHDSQSYLDIVEGLIFVGHVHIRSNYERIYAQGSFDRISHAEEDPKGFYTASIEKDGSYNVKFIENKTAAVYKSIQIIDTEMVDAILHLEKQIEGLPDGSAIRICAAKDCPLFANLSLIKDRWPMYTWTTHTKEKEKTVAKKLIDHKQTYVPLQINRQNLSSIVQTKLEAMAYQGDMIQRCIAALDSVVSTI